MTALPQGRRLPYAEGLVALTLVLGLVALVALVVGVGLVLVRGAREARDEEGPRSQPTDFVAPVSSGRYRFRGADESPEEFRARVKMDEDGERAPKNP